MSLEKRRAAASAWWAWMPRLLGPHVERLALLGDVEAATVETAPRAGART